MAAWQMEKLPESRRQVGRNAWSHLNQEFRTMDCEMETKKSQLFTFKAGTASAEGLPVNYAGAKQKPTK